MPYNIPNCTCFGYPRYCHQASATRGDNICRTERERRESDALDRLQARRARLRKRISEHLARAAEQACYAYDPNISGLDEPGDAIEAANILRIIAN